MRHLLTIFFFFITSLAFAQIPQNINLDYDNAETSIIAEDLCWSYNSIDSSITRFTYVDPVDSSSTILYYLDQEGTIVDITAGGTFEFGFCGCCGEEVASVTRAWYHYPGNNNSYSLPLDTLAAYDLLTITMRHSTGISPTLTLPEFPADSTFNGKTIVIHFEGSENADSIFVEAAGLSQLVQIDCYAKGKTIQRDTIISNQDNDPGPNLIVYHTSYQDDYVRQCQGDVIFSEDQLTSTGLLRQSSTGGVYAYDDALNGELQLQYDYDFANAADAVGAKAILGQIIRIGDARYQVKADSVSGYMVDSLAVIPVSSGYANLIVPGGGLDVKWFGAKDVVPYNNIQNQVVLDGYTPSPGDESDIAIYKAIQYAANHEDRNGTPTARLLFSGQFVVTDSTFTVPNGVEIWCIGASHIHSDHNKPLFIFDSHFGTSHRVKVTHKPWGGLVDGAEWFPINSDTDPRDSTSIGIKVLNCRRSSFYDITARNFRHNLEVMGNAAGCVENRFYISELWDAKWDIYIDGENFGWAHQNYFEGGLAKTHGTPNRNRAIEVECGSAFVNANNCTFQHINFEGSTNRKYAVYVAKSSNHFYNCRFETVLAKQIVFTDVSRSNEIHGSYGFANSRPTAPLPLYYSTDGVTPVQDASGNDARGLIFEGNAVSYSLFWGGSAILSGGQGGANGTDHNSTLTLGTAQSGDNAVNLLEARGGGENQKISFEVTGKGEVRHWGTPNLTGGGKQWELFFEERGFNVTPVTYTSGNWYSYGQILDNSGTEYASLRAFKATDISTDLSSKNIVPNNGSRNPNFKIGQSGLEVSTINGYIREGDTYATVPTFSQGFAMSETGGNYLTLFANPQALVVAGRPGYILRNNDAFDYEVTFNTENYTPGQIFYIAGHRINNGNIVIKSTTVNSLDGQDIVIRAGDIHYFRCLDNASSLRIHETMRSTIAINHVGTTAGRPSDLTTEEKGFEYFDTDLNRQVIWNGSSWNDYVLVLDSIQNQIALPRDTTAKTLTFTLEIGELTSIDVSSSPATATVPIGAISGQSTFTILDVSNNASANNITLDFNTNYSTTNSNETISTDGFYGTWWYHGPDRGWRRIR
ncbi:MAG: hypothetical protein MI974_31920 [Chitinophagales bacterium]|nr:hypothetical protein [Chitinophagales bacterium]